MTAIVRLAREIVRASIPPEGMRAFARSAGVHRKTVENFLAGKESWPENIEAMLNAAGHTLLIGRLDNPSREPPVEIGQ